MHNNYQCHSIEENNMPTVALLDVDGTLLGPPGPGGEPTVNWPLIHGLRKAGIRDIYLFTDMSCKPNEIIERDKLISLLEKEGLTVKGVITPLDTVAEISDELVEDFLNQVFVERGIQLTDEMAMGYIRDVLKLTKYSAIKHLVEASELSDSSGASYQHEARQLHASILTRAEAKLNAREVTTLEAGTENVRQEIIEDGILTEMERKRSHNASNRKILADIVSMLKWAKENYEAHVNLGDHVKAVMFRQFTQHHRHDNIILCDDLDIALKHAERIPTPSSLMTVHINSKKEADTFSGKRADKYAQLFASHDYQKYSGQKARAFAKAEKAFAAYFRDSNNYYHHTKLGKLASFFNKRHVKKRLEAPKTLITLFKTYDESNDVDRETKKQALVSFIQSTLKEFKPRYFGNYAKSLQYQVFLALHKHPELIESVKPALPEKEWNKAWEKFEKAREQMKKPTEEHNAPSPKY